MKRAFHRVWTQMRDDLDAAGIEIELPELDDEFPFGGRVKVAFVTPDLKDSVDETRSTPRDQVLMVRVDEETSEALDAWVETGAVRSRSEAAALFIREGLQVRADELSQLRGALDDLEQAKERLRKKAAEVFGG